MLKRLTDGAEGQLEETPKSADKCFQRVDNILIGSADTAAQAARRSLRSSRMDATIFSNKISGEARVYHVVTHTEGERHYFLLT